MKQTRRFLALLLALCLSWSQVSPAFAVALDEEQTEPVVVVEETVAVEVVETEAVTEAPEVPETEAPAEEPEVIETEAATEAPEVVETEVAEEEVIAEEAANEEAVAGSSAENPIVLDTAALKWDDNYISARTTVTAPVGTTWYSIAITDMVVNVNGMPVSGKLYGTEPQVFSITNDGEAEAEYEIILAYPVGSDYNPAQLTIGENMARVAAGNRSGYHASWVAPSEGELTITVDTSASIWQYSIVTFDAEGKPTDVTHNSEEETIVASDTITVAAGDKVNVVISTWLDKTTTNPAGVINFTASFVSTVPGANESNPISIDSWVWNETNTEATATVTAPVGTTWYSSYGIGGMGLSINGGEATLLPGGNPKMPVTFSIVNNGEAEATYELKVSYLPGHQMNPVVLSELTGGEASLAAGGAGYYYTYTATETGSYTFYIGSITEGVVGDIIIYNQTSYVQKALTTDGVDNYGLEVTMDVTAGDELSIQLAVQPDANWEYPAADISWVASFAYPAGSELNPIMPEFAWNEAYTEATATVTVPAGTTYHFAAYASGMLLSINDGEPVLLVAEGMGRTPAYFTITNDDEEAAEYTLLLTYPMGSQMNPETLYGRGTSYVSLEAADFDGYFYTYTADATGTLLFSLTEITEGVEADISVTVGYANKTLIADGVDGVLEVPVTEGDELSIQVVALPDANWEYPAADITWDFNFPVGSQLNPIYPEFVWNEAWTEADATVTVPAGATYVFAAYASGMELTINGGEPTLLVAEGMGRAPAYFTITNEGTEAAEYALHLVYPAGHMQNPEVLSWLGSNYTTLAAGDYDGYYYTYTAEADGTLNVSMDSVTEGVVADISVTVGNANRNLMYDGVDGVVSVDVVAGDVVTVQVVTLPDANWEYPAADVMWTINYTAGHELNPIFPEFVWNEAYTEAEATVSVPAGETYHYASYGAGGMLLSINGAEPQLLKAEGMGRAPAYFTITNESDADADYALHLSYPVGNRMNPAELLLADEYTPDVVNVATLDEGNWDGYVYAWTAPEAGELTITMHNGKAGWSYSIQNMTTYASTDMHSSADVPAVVSETISVNAGDEIWVMINTCGASVYDVTPAGEVYFTAEYTMAVGIETNPILPEWIWNEANTEATATFTAPVGTTYYGITMSGMLMSVNGGELVAVNGSRWMPELHTFENTTGEAVEVALYICYPDGTVSNPTVIAEGTTSVELAEASEGHYYTFIAPDRGEVSVTVNSEIGWQYFVNNMTSYVYGDMHWCDENPVVSTETISVNKGDQLVIFVNTYDPANSWGAPPAGTVSLDVVFAAAEGTETNPIMIYDASGDFFGELPAYVTEYYSVYGIGGMYMDLYAGEGVQLELNGEIYTANEYGWISVLIPASPMGGRMPVSFAIVNPNDYECFYNFYFFHPYGSMGNPARPNIGKNEAYVEENDPDGFTYQWTADKDGFLTITMTSKVWSYTLSNLTAGIYGDNLSSTDETVVKSQTIQVSAGDEIQLIVSTPFDYTTFTSPAGIVKFTVSYNATQVNMLSGKSVTLKFTDPATGKAVSGSKVTWEITSGAEFATVKNGKLTANKGITEPTTVKVVATLKADESVVNTFVVTIYPAATEVKIYNTTWDVEAQEEVTEEVTGKTLNIYTNGYDWPQFSAVVGPEAAQDEVTWKSSNTKIAGVNEAGFYLMWNEKKNAPATGTVTLTATAADGSGKKATVKVVIATLVDWMEITDKAGNDVTSIGSGKSVNLVANVNPDATNKKVTWEIISGAEYAKISKTGKLTANKGLTSEQIVTVQATAQDASEVYATIDITIKPLAAKVVITGAPEDNKFDMNSWWPAFYLGAEVLAADGTASAEQNVTWKSSNTKVATIDEYGSVYCNKPGTVTFTATATDGSNKKATVKVTIIKTVAELQLDANAIVAGGKSLTLKPVINDADATNKKLTWSISDNEVGAKISKSGKLTTKKVTEPTDVIVTCATTDGSNISASCTVTIYPATTKVTIMQYGAAIKGTQAMTVGEEKVFYAECLPENAADQYTWKSSNEKIAKIEVNADGSVTIIAVGEKTGTVTITATAIDGTNKKATMKIKVTPAE